MSSKSRRQSASSRKTKRNNFNNVPIPSLRRKFYDALDGDSTLQSLVSDVYDFVPENATFPYVKLGEETSVDNGTKTLQGNEHTLVIHTFSRYRGSKETKEIMSRIYALLHESSLSVTGASLVNLRFEFSDVINS